MTPTIAIARAATVVKRKLITATTRSASAAKRHVSTTPNPKKRKTAMSVRMMPIIMWAIGMSVSVLSALTCA